jgi:hypothetical protein
MELYWKNNLKGGMLVEYSLTLITTTNINGINKRRHSHAYGIITK